MSQMSGGSHSGSMSFDDGLRDYELMAEAAVARALTEIDATLFAELGPSPVAIATGTFATPKAVPRGFRYAANTAINRAAAAAAASAAATGTATGRSSRGENANASDHLIECANWRRAFPHVRVVGTSIPLPLAPSTNSAAGASAVAANTSHSPVRRSGSGSNITKSAAAITRHSFSRSHSHNSSSHQHSSNGSQSARARSAYVGAGAGSSGHNTARTASDRSARGGPRRISSAEGRRSVTGTIAEAAALLDDSDGDADADAGRDDTNHVEDDADDAAHKSHRTRQNRRPARTGSGLTPIQQFDSVAAGRATAPGESPSSNRSLSSSLIRQSPAAIESPHQPLLPLLTSGGSPLAAAASATATALAASPTRIDPSALRELTVVGRAVRLAPTAIASTNASAPDSKQPATAVDFDPATEEVFAADGTSEEVFIMDRSGSPFSSVEHVRGVTLASRVKKQQRMEANGYPPLTPERAIEDERQHQRFERVWSGVIDALTPLIAELVDATIASAPAIPPPAASAGTAAFAAPQPRGSGSGISSGANVAIALPLTVNDTKSITPAIAVRAPNVIHPPIATIATIATAAPAPADARAIGSDVGGVLTSDGDDPSDDDTTQEPEEEEDHRTGASNGAGANANSGPDRSGGGAQFLSISTFARPIGGASGGSSSGGSGASAGSADSTSSPVTGTAIANDAAPASRSVPKPTHVPPPIAAAAAPALAAPALTATPLKPQKPATDRGRSATISPSLYRVRKPDLINSVGGQPNSVRSPVRSTTKPAIPPVTVTAGAAPGRISPVRSLVRGSGSSSGSPPKANPKPANPLARRPPASPLATGNETGVSIASPSPSSSSLTPRLPLSGGWKPDDIAAAVVASYGVVPPPLRPRTGTAAVSATGGILRSASVAAFGVESGRVRPPTGPTPAAAVIATARSQLTALAMAYEQPIPLPIASANTGTGRRHVSSNSIPAAYKSPSRVAGGGDRKMSGSGAAGGAAVVQHPIRPKSSYVLRNAAAPSHVSSSRGAPNVGTATGSSGGGSGSGDPRASPHPRHGIAGGSRAGAAGTGTSTGISMAGGASYSHARTTATTFTGSGSSVASVLSQRPHTQAGAYYYRTGKHTARSTAANGSGAIASNAGTSTAAGSSGSSVVLPALRGDSSGGIGTASSKASGVRFTDSRAVQKENHSDTVPGSGGSGGGVDILTIHPTATTSAVAIAAPVDRMRNNRTGAGTTGSMRPPSSRLSPLKRP